MKIGYARVSTNEQNLDLQINALKGFNCEIIFQEKKSAVKERPELEKMLAYARNGDIVVVWKLDRLGRTLSHLLKIIEDLRKRNISFVSLNDNIDSSSAGGKFYLQMIGAMAEFERNLGVERTNAGLEAARQRGVILGRRKGLTEKSKAIAKAACNLYLNGNMGTKEISDSLGISTATLYRYLEYNKIVKRNNPGRPKKSL